MTVVQKMCLLLPCNICNDTTKWEMTKLCMSFLIIHSDESLEENQTLNCHLLTQPDYMMFKTLFYFHINLAQY